MNQRRRVLKSNFLSRKKVFGCWTSLYHPSTIEIFCRAGIDFIGIDLEHSTINLEQTQQMILACQANNICCLPRVPSLDKTTMKRLLDSGADGLMVPMISSGHEVLQFTSWAKYPPIGERSFGVARSHGYGFDFETYTKNWNDSSTLIVQIETIDGVRNIDEIVSHPYVDGAMIGPYDLSGSLGVPGQLSHPRVTEACQKVIAACKEHGKACGTHIVDPDFNTVSNAFISGYTFVILASDVFLLWKWAERMKDLMSLINSRK